MGTKPRTFAFVATFMATLLCAVSGRAETDFAKLFPSVVRIVVFLDEDQGSDLGSGVVVASSDAGSYVVTNAHVVEDSTDGRNIFVVTPKGEDTGYTMIRRDVPFWAAQLVGGNRGTDLAILYVPKLVRPAVPLYVGPDREDTPVRAIGYPGFDLNDYDILKVRPTMTDGIISSTQTAPWEGQNVAVLQIQHTAAVNPGMSGGGLFDLCGRVMGLNKAYRKSSNSVMLALASTEITPFLQRQNIGFTSAKDTCNPNAPTPPVVNAPVINAPVTNAIGPTKPLDSTAVRLGIGAGVVVLLLGLLGIGIWLAQAGKRRQAEAAAVAGAETAAPAGPPHGLALRGINEASGKMQVVRQDELRNEMGIELGRSSGFGSPGTSRRHARIVWTAAGGFAIRDLGSSGGTRVNGREIKGAGDAAIHLGDVIEFGAPDARYTVEKI
ncbi:MAG TPA: trypsin-like peptidase domain-containing protein [Caulobacteraceae bacterium]|nr:trypsin-like peptidase domain-containing protein [Caulobacteraceae bacterium]